MLQRLPGFLQSLISLLVAAGVYSIDSAPNHVLVNSYGPSGAIPPHTDGEPAGACMPYKLTQLTWLPPRCACAEPASAGLLADIGSLQQPVRQSCTNNFACCKRILRCMLGTTTTWACADSLKLLVITICSHQLHCPDAGPLYRPCVATLTLGGSAMMNLHEANAEGQSGDLVSQVSVLKQTKGLAEGVAVHHDVPAPKLRLAVCRCSSGRDACS